MFHPNWYSILHENGNGANIQHWAFDSSSQRVLSHIFLTLQDPQIAVTPDKVDSSLYRMALSRGASEPRWMIPGYSGTYKLGGVDTLWGYHSISEIDTAAGVYIHYGYGELGVEDENGLVETDLIARDENGVIDSSHTRQYFMRSENFTLPSVCVVQYCPWMYSSSDTLFRLQYEGMTFALDFYDTTGAFVFRIDSLELTDSLPRVPSNLRQVSIDRESSQRGYVVFSRVSGELPDSGAVWNSIISTSKFSEHAAFKRAGRSLTSPTIAFTAVPNPFSSSLTLDFTLPGFGAVTMEVFDALGKRVADIATARHLAPGRHSLEWKPEGLASGVYTFKLTFGNITQIVKAIYAK